MFAGHYAASFAVGGWQRKLPLWQLFVATQFLDMLWGAFVLTGLEKARFAPGIAGPSPLSLYYMPYSHSLPAALAWSGLIAAGFLVLRREGSRQRTVEAMAVGVAVFSHWLLDLLSHQSDLPLYGNHYKVGFGLESGRGMALSVEAVLLAGGLLLFLRGRPGMSRRARIGLVAISASAMVIQAIRSFGLPAPVVGARAAMLLVYYAILAAGAFWVDRMGASASGPAHETNRGATATAP